MKYFCLFKIGFPNCQWLLFQTACSVGKLSKSLGLQKTSSMLKTVSTRIPAASRQTLRLSERTSMSNTQEGITLPMRHDEKRTVKYYEKRFDCREAQQRGEKINSERFRARSRSARGGKRERALFIFSRLRALLGSLQSPSVGNVTRRRPERTLFTVANSWTSRDCESQIALRDLRSFGKSQAAKVESRIEY